jgi:hypothetical protein
VTVSIYNVKNFPGALPPDPKNREGTEGKEGRKGRKKEGTGMEQREGDRNSEFLISHKSNHTQN